MTSVYFFKLSEKNEFNTELPTTLIEHCKKPESVAAARALLDMGVTGLRYEENGKPIADNCFVSISHSNNIIAVCKSDRPVGIDVEIANERRNIERLAKRVFKEQELDLFEKNPTAEAFYEIWTKKEAYSKIIGKGTIEIMKGFDLFKLKDYTFHTEKVDNFIISICEKI